MSVVKIGDKYTALQPFAGVKFSFSQEEEITVTKSNIDDVELWLRGGLVIKTFSFPEPEKGPEQANENPGVLPVGGLPRPRSRGRTTPSDGG